MGAESRKIMFAQHLLKVSQNIEYIETEWKIINMLYYQYAIKYEECSNELDNIYIGTCPNVFVLGIENGYLHAHIDQNKCRSYTTSHGHSTKIIT